ncbi:Tm-1-like ATP-binding domain-containing protein [Paenibacillus abyssi]|uniref:Uncharacterized protein n=1 Tax=Paenibacillus abyssi TaxID=1340531 RepID=A0A917CYL9_9BACL|nr:Tm-1-like ATP-binding domain-containing protein [Paenibacillus abyssi]GGG02263.1 hypothetical protein GCM10010916_19310 [Paenibacillus abyssi]
MDSKVILLLGAYDMKGEEYDYVAACIEGRGHRTLKMDFSVIGSPKSGTVDIGAERVAEAAGSSLTALREAGDRGKAMSAMSEGAARLVRLLYDEGKFDGIFGMGGTGGSSVISAAMRSLPLGVPKVLVSTAASGDTRMMLDTRDITLIPSVVDVAGVNRISRVIYREAVGAICGMVEMEREETASTRPVVAVTMFGNTTECVNRCRNILENSGYEVLVFHCTGTGGRTMEQLVEDGLISAVLDITTTEWADELCGGVFAAGPDRLEAAGKAGIPHLIVPGCVDMVNFGPRATVPDTFADRKLYIWNPGVTLMRTTPEENERMGRIFAEKANRAGGPTAFLLPLRGVSILGTENNEFWWPEADQAMFSAIKTYVKDEIPVEEVDAAINDPEFADRAVGKLMELMKGGGAT